MGAVGECLPIPPSHIQPGDCDLCVCRDTRAEHRNRSGECLVCRGSMNPDDHCRGFQLVEVFA